MELRVKLKTFLIKILIVLTLMVIFILNLPFKRNNKYTLISINRGENAKEIAIKLKDRGIILNEVLFYIYLKLSGSEKKLKSGTYIFKRPLTMIQVKNLLEKGGNFFVKITIKEGENFFEIAQKVSSIKYLRAKDFKKYYSHTEFLKGITNEAKNLEGYLFPDTYKFSTEVTSITLIKTMVENFKKRVLPVIRIRTNKKLSLHQIVTLASLIEKETPLLSEKRIISSIFYNRLEKGMRLQCDPTVIYAKILAGLKNEKKIFKRDLKINSPYNTYFIKGLPPGPICNPGLGSIIAACNPAKTNYLYFVSKNNGHHFFSSNLREHIKAVNKYQRKRKKQDY